MNMDRMNDTDSVDGINGWIDDAEKQAFVSLWFLDTSLDWYHAGLY